MKNILQVLCLIVGLAGIAAAYDIAVVPAPEIGAGSAASAVGLLGGVLLVMRSRRKK